MSEEICQNIETVSDRIARASARAGRDPGEVQLIAVGKLKPLQDIKTAFGYGQLHFGENRAQELQDKMERFDEERLRWHMVGNLQTNKIKYIAERVDWIDSVSRQKVLGEIEKRASRNDRVINTLIQINISGEDQKGGCKPADLAGLLEYAQGLEHVRVWGLMGMGTFARKENVERVRPEFRLLRELRDEHRSYEGETIRLEHLSMGMSNDMEVAIEEGSTMVRVGRAIFGKRNYE